MSETPDSTESADTSASTTSSPTPPKSVVASITKFVAAEGGSAKAVIQPVGAAGVRITLVGANGILGDRVVTDTATAHAVVDAVAGLEEAEWDRELTSETTVSPAHYRKMAGWVAHQERFPRPRNSAIL